MNLRLFVCVSLSTAGAVTVSCKEDPTASEAGVPAQIVFTVNPLFLGSGDSATITAQVVDRLATPLAGAITGVSNAPTLLSVGPAAVPPDPTGTTAVFKVKGLAPGPAYLKASAKGITDSARVNVMPSPFVFDGALSGTTPAGGSVLTIQATGSFRFDPARATVTFGGGIEGPIILATATELQVVTPFSDPDSLQLTGIVLPYVEAKTFDVPTAVVVTQTGDFYGSTDSSFATAPTLSLPGAAGQSTAIITDVAPTDTLQCAEMGAGFAFGSKGPCMMYKFTVGAPTDLTFEVGWDGDADFDVYACPAPQSTPADLQTCQEEGAGGATGANPESFTFTFPAGTHYFVIEQFDKNKKTGPPRNIITTITRN